MEEENQLQLPVKELVRSDLNLEKWEIFATRKHTGERKIIRKTACGPQTVEIGLTVRGGKQYTLTAGEGKVFYTLLKKWEDAGKPTDRPVQFTMRSLCKELNINVSSGTRHLKERLLNLTDIPIRFVECYETPAHTDTITTAFHLLSQLKVFERRKKADGTIENYFGFSEFKIHETIMDTILKKGMKPVRLDVIRTLKSDCAFILYRYLDLILFGKSKHEEDLLSIAKICDLQQGQRTRKVKRTIEHALDELKGKDLTSGRIVIAEVLKSDTPSGWKISVIKGKQIDTLPNDPVAPEKEAFDFDRYFQSLPVEEQEAIKKQAEEEAKADLIFSTLSEGTKQVWNAGIIKNILKERIAQAQLSPAPLKAEKRQKPAGRKVRSKELKATNQNKKGVEESPAEASVSASMPESANHDIKIAYQNASAREVKIAGDWNGWQPEAMQQVSAGAWEKKFTLLPGTYKYKLVVDGNWITNPDGEIAGDSFGNNILEKTA